MSGKYLRKIEGDKPRDPTMTHMVDPYIVRVGDWLQDSWGCCRVIAIDEARFDNPNIRFAHLTEEGIPGGGAVIHDLREEDARTDADYYRRLRAIP